MFCNNNIRVFTEKYGRSFENLLSQIYSKHLYFSFSVLRGCFRRQQNSHKFSKFSTRFRNHFHTLLLRTETQFSHHVGEQGSTWWRLFVCRNEISAAKTCNFNFRPIVYRPSRLCIDRADCLSTENREIQRQIFASRMRKRKLGNLLQCRDPLQMYISRFSTFSRNIQNLS